MHISLSRSPPCAAKAIAYVRESVSGPFWSYFNKLAFMHACSSHKKGPRHIEKNERIFLSIWNRIFWCIGFHAYQIQAHVLIINVKPTQKCQNCFCFRGVRMAWYCSHKGSSLHVICTTKPSHCNCSVNVQSQCKDSPKSTTMPKEGRNRGHA